MKGFVLCCSLVVALIALPSLADDKPELAVGLTLTNKYLDADQTGHIWHDDHVGFGYFGVGYKGFYAEVSGFRSPSHEGGDEDDFWLKYGTTIYSIDLDIEGGIFYYDINFPDADVIKPYLSLTHMFGAFETSLALSYPLPVHQDAFDDGLIASLSTSWERPLPGKWSMTPEAMITRDFSGVFGVDGSFDPAWIGKLSSTLNYAHSQLISIDAVSVSLTDTLNSVSDVDGRGSELIVGAGIHLSF